MQSWRRQPSCFMSYFLLALSGSLFFFHCTDTTGLESSQHRDALPPSSTSTLTKSFLKNGGISGKIDQKQKPGLCAYAMRKVLET